MKYLSLQHLNKFLAIALLSLLLVGMIYAALLHTVWATTPPSWDFATHLRNARIYAMLLRRYDFVGLAVYYSYYPPLVYILAAVVYLILGPFLYNYLFLTLFLLTLAMFFIFSICFRRFGILVGIIVSGGFLSFLLASASIDVRYWEFMLDLPMTIAVLATSWYIFSCTKKQTPLTIYEGLLVGLLAGVSMLIKWTAAAFIIFPLGVFVISTIQKKTYPAILGFGIGFSPALLWYAGHWPELWKDFVLVGIQEGKTRADPVGLQGMLYYLQIFLSILKPLWPLVLISGMLLISLPRRWMGKRYAPVYGTVVFPFLLLSLLPHKDPRYLYPWYVALWLLILTLAFKNIPNLIQKTGVSLSLIVFGVLFVQNISERDTQNYVLNQVPTLVVRYNPLTLGYFFESDSSFFNYANVKLLNIDTPFIFLNSFAGNPFTCDASDDLSEILVYSPIEGDTRVSFKKQCAPLLQTFEQQEMLSGDDGVLYYFRRNSPSGSE